MLQRAPTPRSDGEKPFQPFLCRLSRQSPPLARITGGHSRRTLWLTEERGAVKSLAKNSKHGLNAASVHRWKGAFNESFRASPTSPVMAFFLARGWTLTATVARRVFMNRGQSELEKYPPLDCSTRAVISPGSRAAHRYQFLADFPTPPDSRQGPRRRDRESCSMQRC